MGSNRREFIATSAIGVLGAWVQQSAAAQQVEPPVASRKNVDSIAWYYEIRGRGPSIVLIPSGEGDCGSFDKVAALLAPRFRMLTFDMPGFSRSGDPPNFDHYTWGRAADEIAAGSVTGPEVSNFLWL